MLFDFESMRTVTQVFMFLLAGLSIASIIGWGLSVTNKEKDYTELKQRINSWWIMIGIFGLALVMGPLVTVLLFAMLSFIALKEYFSMTPTRLVDRKVLFWAYLTIPIQYYWIATGWYGMFIIFIPVYAFLFIPFRMVLAGETKNYLRAVGNIHWGLMLTVFTLSHLAYLVMIPSEGEYQSLTMSGDGAALLLYLVMLTQLNDVAQYVWGKILGTTPIAPTISPNKTREGLIGGVITTGVLAMILAGLLTPMIWWQGLLVGLGIGIAGFIGDVSLSAIKRDIGIKDSGQLIPGHGGILDRLDSLTFTAPLFFHVMRYFYF